MSDEEAGVLTFTPAFRFVEPGPELSRVRALLMRGSSLEVAPVEGTSPPEFSIREFDATKYSYDTMAAHACDGCSLGAHINLGQFVARLGTDHLAARLIDEALEAGFSAFLITEPKEVNPVVGCYTLIAAVADNS